MVTSTVFDRTERKSVRDAAVSRKVFHAAERSAEFFDHLRAHYREARRTSVEIETEISVRLESGELYDAGTATILNVSPSGALLGRIKLARRCLPLEPFKIEMVMKGSEYDGIGVEARPVRFEPSVSGIGVRFEEIFVTV